MSLGTVLGKGAYGSVTARDGVAVKKFSSLRHVIQEYTALRYLEDCRYVVHVKGVDFASLELKMELYDESLRLWIAHKRDRGDILKVIHDILCGLVELHDRNLAHGDLKLGNVLVRRNPVRAVLGDCGFVSLAKYAKVEHTAQPYRDPVISQEVSHDLFSLGVCLLELLGGVRVGKTMSYSEYQKLAEAVPDNYRKLVARLLQEDKSARPSARELLFTIYGEEPGRWREPTVAVPKSRFSKSVRDELYQFMKVVAHTHKIRRGRRAYYALDAYLSHHDIESKHHREYAVAALYIVGANFGHNNFHTNLALTEGEMSLSKLQTLVGQLLHDRMFRNVMLLSSHTSNSSGSN